MSNTSAIERKGRYDMRRIIKGVVGVIVGGSVMAACSSSSSSGSSSSASATKAAPVNVTIGYTAVGAGYADLYVGTLDGIFKKNGLNVTLDNLDNSSLLVPSLVSGAVQIGVGVANDTAAAILKGQKLTYIAMSEPVYNLQLWGAKDITSVKGLIGQKVATSGPGSESFFGLKALLKEDHVPASQVPTVDVVNPQAQVSALLSGSVDAILTQPPTGSQTAAHGFHQIAALNNLPFGLGAYTVTSSYAAGNASVLKRFAKAEVENLAFLRSHPKQTLAAIEKDSGVASPALAENAYKFFLGVWATNPSVSTSIIQSAFAAASASTGIPAPSDVGKYIDNSFVDAARTSS